MNSLGNDEVVDAILEMRDLLRLLAEPAIAERDQKARDRLRLVAGTSAPKIKAALLMDGTRTQLAIHKQINIHQGQLSTFVKQLGAENLLAGDPKQPKLSISIPTNFFEQESK